MRPHLELVLVFFLSLGEEEEGDDGSADDDEGEFLEPRSERSHLEALPMMMFHRSEEKERRESAG